MAGLMFVWLMAATIAFVALPFVHIDPPQRRSLVIIVLVGAIAHIVPIVLYRQPQGLYISDINNLQDTARLVLARTEVYQSSPLISLHPYLPFQMYVAALAELIARHTPASFFVLIRLPQAAADVGTAILITMTMRTRTDERTAFVGGLMYAVCPMPMAISVYHGQFDGISVFFAVAAVYLLLIPATARVRDLSAVALGLGILQKAWPMFLLPVLVARMGRGVAPIRYAAIVSAVVFLSLLIYVVVFGSSLHIIYTETTTYRPPFPVVGGLPLILDRLPPFPGRDGLLAWWIEHGKATAAIVALLLGALLSWRRVEVATAVVAVLCVLFVFVPDGSAYHYLWIVPFALIAGHRIGAAAIALATTATYVIVGILGGGMYIPPVEGAGIHWLYLHKWWFDAFLWATFAVWGICILLDVARPSRDPSSGGRDDFVTAVPPAS